MATGIVIVVPGIGGSELFTPRSAWGLGPPIHLWMNPASLIAGGWRLLGLQPDGITPNVPLLGPLEPGGPLRSYYSTFTSNLCQLGWIVTAAHCDWRGTIRRDAEQLAVMVRASTSSAPVHLVGHSRGGLVIRQALQILQGSGHLGLVGRVVGLGVPHWGSIGAAGLLAGWNRYALLLNFMAVQLPLLMTGRSLPGQLHDVVSTWPSAYELLPRPSAPGLDPSMWEALYSSSAWSAAGYPVSTAWLSAARAAWSALPDSPSSIPWLNVVGYGMPTPDGFLSSSIPTSPSVCRWTLSGDGTVPTAWAVQPSGPVVQTPTSHDQLIFDGRILPYLDTWLRGGAVADTLIEGSLLY